MAELVAPAEAAELDSVGAALQAIVAEDPGPPLSRYMETQGTREQMLEHVVHRSAYQLKEADPHSWAIPRLSPGPKAALLEVQFDEYGGGSAERMHSVLFAKTMEALGPRPDLRPLPRPLAGRRPWRPSTWSPASACTGAAAAPSSATSPPSR